MKTVIGVTLVAMFLTGCVGSGINAITPYIDSMCESATQDRNFRKAMADGITYPHRVRIHCYAQAKELHEEGEE